MNGLITWASKPDHDDWGFDTYWSCEQWMIWHKELVKKFGREGANNRFINEASKATFGAVIYDCKYNKAFVSYFKSQGINIGNSFSKTAINVGKGLENTSYLVKYLPLVAIGAVGLFFYAKNKKWI